MTPEHNAIIEHLARIDALVARSSKIDPVRVYGNFFIEHSAAIRKCFEEFAQLQAARQSNQRSEPLYFVCDERTNWKMVSKRIFDETPPNRQWLLYETPTTTSDVLEMAAEVCHTLIRTHCNTPETVNVMAIARDKIRNLITHPESTAPHPESDGK